MILNKMQAVTLMLAETNEHYKVSAHTMKLLFPDRMLGWGEEFVLLIGSNLLLELVPQCIFYKKKKKTSASSPH